MTLKWLFFLKKYKNRAASGSFAPKLPFMMLVSCTTLLVRFWIKMFFRQTHLIFEFKPDPFLNKTLVAGSWPLCDSVLALKPSTFEFLSIGVIICYEIKKILGAIFISLRILDGFWTVALFPVAHPNLTLIKFTVLFLINHTNWCSF